MRETDQRVLSLMMDERAYDYRQISTISGRPIGSLGPTRDRIIRKLRTNPQVAELMAASEPSLRGWLRGRARPADPRMGGDPAW